MTQALDPRTLILETSGRIGRVAVAHGDRVLGERQLDQARRHARDLAPSVRELLGEQGWRPADIDAVLVSRGPGSYTGLRVGIMSAKAFAYATGCAILGIDTFAAIAIQALPAAPLDVIADAQQDRLYVQQFTVSRTSPASQVPVELTILPGQEWLGTLAPGAWVSGPGLALWRERLPAHVQVVEPPLWEPQPASILQLGLARLAAGDRDDCWSLEPLYLRESEAEAKWGKR